MKCTLAEFTFIKTKATEIPLLPHAFMVKHNEWEKVGKAEVLKDSFLKDSFLKDSNLERFEEVQVTLAHSFRNQGVILDPA